MIIILKCIFASLGIFEIYFENGSQPRFVLITALVNVHEHLDKIKNYIPYASIKTIVSLSIFAV